MRVPFLVSRGVCLLAACFLFSLSARADVILVIDISNPAQVTFTATNAPSENNDDESFLQEGIALIDFFQASVDDSSVYFFDTPLDLWSPGGDFAYTTLTSLDFTGTIPFVYDDLSIFGSGFSAQDFSTGAPALTGSATADLTAWTPYLPGAGTTGNIYSGDGISFSGPQLGQYSVVPEPSIPALLVFVGLIILLRSNCRKSRLLD